MITSAQAWSRPVLIGGYQFGLSDRNYAITELDGWADTAKPDAVLVPNGGGAGSVASGAWLPTEQPLTISGVVFANRATQSVVRAGLLAALPAGAEAVITMQGIDEPDLIAYVRRYDRAQFVQWPDRMTFVLPLIMLDPYKYGLTALSGSMGAYSGSDWLETFALTSGTWYETFAKVSGVWVETYTKAVSTSPYPDSLTLITDATVSSRRVTVMVAGPLVAGDWYLLQQSADNRRMWVEVAVAAGQTVVIDCLNETATLAGSDVSHLLFGDMFTLEPGSNAYRLVTNTPNAAAYALVSGLPAYE
jgi:hypothetical protein